MYMDNGEHLDTYETARERLERSAAKGVLSLSTVADIETIDDIREVSGSIKEGFIEDIELLHEREGYDDKKHVNLLSKAGLVGQWFEGEDEWRLRDAALADGHRMQGMNVEVKMGRLVKDLLLVRAKAERIRQAEEAKLLARQAVELTKEQRIVLDDKLVEQGKKTGEIQLVTGLRVLFDTPGKRKVDEMLQSPQQGKHAIDVRNRAETILQRRLSPLSSASFEDNPIACEGYKIIRKVISASGGHPVRMHEVAMKIRGDDESSEGLHAVYPDDLLEKVKLMRSYVWYGLEAILFEESAT